MINHPNQSSGLSTTLFDPRYIADLTDPW